MDKILVEVFFPAAEKTYQAELPLDLRLQEVTRLLSKMLEELEPGRYCSGGETALLCDRATGGIFNAACTPRELGWQNGDQLLLI